MNMPPNPQHALDLEISAYNSVKELLQEKYLGKWVVFYGSKLQGTYDDFDTAACDAVKKFGRGPYLIREVGEEDLTLPTSVVYAISHNAF